MNKPIMNFMKNSLLLIFVLILNMLFSCQNPVDPHENMVYIPADEFRMGSIYVAADGDEQPLHTVYVDAFYIDKYEVTVGEDKRFIIKTGYVAPDWENIAKYSPTDNHPIINVNWYDAMFMRLGWVNVCLQKLNRKKLHEVV